MKILLSFFTAVLFAFSVSSCGGGDDDGQRLGELIVGTWQRGYGPTDIIIEGNTELEPENIAYETFIFQGDGSYNGMVREGSFTSIDKFGSTVYTGTYRCDNNNLKLEFTDESNRQQSLLIQVVGFTTDQLRLNYKNEDYNITVTITLYKR